MQRFCCFSQREGKCKQYKNIWIIKPFHEPECQSYFHGTLLTRMKRRTIDNHPQSPTYIIYRIVLSAQKTTHNEYMIKYKKDFLKNYIV